MNVKKRPKPPTRKESISQSTPKSRVPVESDETQYMDLLPRSEPPLQPYLPVTRSEEYQATKDDNFKSDLEKIFNSKSGQLPIAYKPTPSVENGKSAVGNSKHPKVKKPPVQIPAKPQESGNKMNSGGIARQTQSFRLPSSQTRPTIQRTASFQLQPVLEHVEGKGIKKESSAGQPQLPRRNGQTLITAIE